MKKMNKKGFTLAELLIVVAIIAVLVAIAIPVFSAQLYKSQAATDEANIRSKYSEAVVKFLDSDQTTPFDEITGVVKHGELTDEYVYTHEKDESLTYTFEFDASVFGEADGGDSGSGSGEGAGGGSGSGSGEGAGG